MLLLRKEGYPAESELVICTVTKIQFNSVFVRIDDYGKSGMIHISEISPGRIRNIRDYVKEGKVVVCVVLRINLERGHIDLSLRRVNDSQRRKTIDNMKQEQRAEKILEYVAKNNSMDVRKLFDEVWDKISDEYDDLYGYFEDFVMGNTDFSRLGLPKKVEEMLAEVVAQRVKLPEVEISGEYKISSTEPDGVEVIKKALLAAQKKGGENVWLSYLGAGKYSVRVKAEDYKEAEGMLKDVSDTLTQELDDTRSHMSFARKDE